MSALHQVLQVLSDPAPNPPAKAPDGVAEPVSKLVAYIKWGVLVVIVVAGFIGAGAVAGGRIFAHHGASKIGIGILISALGAAVLYVGIYALITSVTG